MDHSTKILWVHDYFNGPINGLAEYKREKVWFSQVQIPDTPSTNVSMSQSSDDQVDRPLDPPYQAREFTLIRLDVETLNQIQDDHTLYCKETNSPLYHGDTLKIKRHRKIVKMDFSKIIPLDQDGIDASLRSLGQVKTFVHSYDPMKISGEHITTIKEKEFINYLIPRRVEIE